MNGYLIHFATYTFAMIGFIGLAFFIYKKSICSQFNSGAKEYLKIENSLRLSPSKTIYVLKAGEEKFLIAGDSANTTMLAKLNDNNYTTEVKNNVSDINISTMKKLAQRINRG